MLPSCRSLVVVEYQSASVRYDAREAKVGRPSEEVAKVVSAPVPPFEPTRPYENEDAPVPPRSTASVPCQSGVKVWVSPAEMMVRPMLLSDDVAKVWVEPVCDGEY